MKVLIVEDEEDTRRALVNMLRKRQHEVLEASQGKEAIAIIERDKPDLVYLDIQLADDVDGMEVLQQAKAQSPDTEFVIMSAYNEYEGESKKLGAFSFCKKPIYKMENFLNPLEEVKKKKGLQ